MSNVNKFLSLLQELKNNLESKKTTGVNKSGVSHANSLIKSGKVIKPSSWTPPSADAENAYIKANSIEDFGKWHLGIDSEVDPKTKQHWHYIFTSDFKNVDRAGLIAIRQRAGQQKQTDVFEAAGKMLENIDK
jgi:hypothetical protein